MILIVRGGILMSIGNFPESLSQSILAGRFLAGRLGVSSYYVNTCWPGVNGVLKLMVIHLFKSRNKQQATTTKQQQELTAHYATHRDF